MSPPIDERRAFRETVKLAGTAQPHPGAESSEPDAWPPSVHELTRPGVGGPEPWAQLPSLERVGKISSSVHAIYVLIAALAGSLAALVIWVNSRASKADLDEKISTVAAAQKSADDQRDKLIQQLSERVVTLEVKIDEKRVADENRWNGLDRILDRQFGQTTLQTHPPAYGTDARGKGR